MRLIAKLGVRSVFLALLATFILVAPAVTQTVSGFIAGSVVDAQHAAVVKGTVTLTDVEKNVTLTASTDAAGRFVFATVPPGTYRINAQAPGFKEYVQSGIVLNANDRLSVGELVM